MDTKKYDSKIKPTWCPGCGNHGIFSSLKSALAKLGLKPHEIVFVTDVGCSGNMADFVNTYRLHALHGRALPPTAGVKLANHKLHVIAVIGDGGNYGEGLTHHLNLMRGNHDITILCHDNYRYSLTTGQYSPTTPKGSVTKTSPEGSIEEAMNPLAMAIANHATYVARGYAFENAHLTDIIAGAIKHKGFSFVDILQPCVVFNKSEKVDWYKDHVFKLKSKFKTREAAFKEARREGKLGIGVYWSEKKPSYHEEVTSLKNRVCIKKPIEKVNIKQFVEELV